MLQALGGWLHIQAVAAGNRGISSWQSASISESHQSLDLISNRKKPNLVGRFTKFLELQVTNSSQSSANFACTTFFNDLSLSLNTYKEWKLSLSLSLSLSANEADGDEATVHHIEKHSCCERRRYCWRAKNKFAWRFSVVYVWSPKWRSYHLT